MEEFNYFLALEAELENSFNYIEPDVHNFECYGAKYASLLNSVCVEFESVAKSLIKAINPDASVGNIGEIKGQILSLFPKFEENSVEITRLGQVINPFVDWSNDRLEWWDSYTALKHNRIQNYKKANLRNVFLAMSALLVLIVYLERFRDKTRKIRTCKVFWMEVMPSNLVTEGKNLPDTCNA